MADETGNRRIDRIKRADYAQGLEELSLDDVRDRRDECRAELEYLSLLRRLVQGPPRSSRRRSSGDGSAGQRLARGPPRRDPRPGREPRVLPRGGRAGGVPTMLAIARRRVERLVADAGISDPGSLPDDSLATAVDLLFAEERSVSADRAQVIGVLEAVQDEPRGATRRMSRRSSRDRRGTVESSPDRGGRMEPVVSPGGQPARRADQSELSPAPDAAPAANGRSSSHPGSASSPVQLEKRRPLEPVGNRRRPRSPTVP